MLKLFGAAAVAAALIAAPAAAVAQDTFDTYGDVEIVSSGPASKPDVFQLTSSTSGVGYAGLYLEFDTPIALSAITQLSTDYQMTVGT
jgi:hypothetical protein